MENNGLISIGDSFKYSFSYTQDQVILFAEVSGDDNPVHLDKSYAANTVFKKPIIHGFLGGAVFSKVFGTMFPGFGTIYLKQSLTFLKPMYTDEEYTAVFEIMDINREKHRATVTTKVVNRDNEEVISGEAVILNVTKI